MRSKEQNHASTGGLKIGKRGVKGVKITGPTRSTFLGYCAPLSPCNGKEINHAMPLSVELEQLLLQ